MVGVKEHLNLSALAYGNFENADKGKTVGQLADDIKNGVICDGVPCARLMLKLR